MHRRCKTYLLGLSLGASAFVWTASGSGGIGTARAADAAPAPNTPNTPNTPTEAAAADSTVSLGLDPTAPQVGALPGGVTPAFGQKSLSEEDWRFDFHGFLTAPLSIGIGSRDMPAAGQSSTTLHSPPAVPDDLETFSHTGVVPTTYAQLNFSDGNSLVTGNVSILARQANVSTTFLEPASQLGVTDLFVSILPRLPMPNVRTEVLVGAFTSRYGTAGEYDQGRYGTPLIARVNGVGERISARAAVGKWVVLAEEGLAGQSNRAGSGTTPDVWNDFANANEGTSFVIHGHLGASYLGRATLGLHYLRAFSQDDRGQNTLAQQPDNRPDGTIDILGGDLRLMLGRFGHLYLAGSYTDARYAATVSRIISVLNTRGGQGLIDNYFGPTSQGTGTLTTIGGQYDLSIGKLVSYPVPFSGDGPDLFVSVFGMITHVTSDDKEFEFPTAAYRGRYFDGVTKRKLGLEATYSLLSWLAVSGRFDRVEPDTQDQSFSFSVLSPRVILRTNWMATDQVVIQYSHWIDGANTLIRVGDPPKENHAWIPDNDMLSLSASMWW